MIKSRAFRRAARHVLNNTFHKDDFRPGQQKAVLTLLKKQDLLCIFPTGAGKSICFQLPAVIFPGLTLVVSPLIALMTDQVNHLRETGISAEYINSTQSFPEQSDILRRAVSGKIKLLYVSPERLQNPGFVTSLTAAEISMVVVDEAHCVVQWGENFRPAYGQVGAFISSLPHKPVICAMTATADKTMCNSIILSLHMAASRIQTLPLLRENLTYRVIPTMGKNREIMDCIREHPMEKGVIFCRSRKRAEEVANFISAQNLPIAGAAYYHAGLDREERTAVHKKYASGECTVLAATSAFGMGVDIPDVRYIIHDTLPENMIDYAQQSGRAGRDGYESECIVLFDVGDVEKMRHTLQRMRNSKNMSRFRRHRECRRMWAKQKAALTWVMSGKCLRVGLMNIFSQSGTPCGKCSACLSRGNREKFHRVPDLTYLSRDQVCQWALTWQRARLAKTLNIFPQQVLPASRLPTLSQGITLDENDTKNEFVRQRMNSVVEHMKNA